MTRNIHTVPTGSLGQLIGIQQSVKIAQPAAGSDWTYTLPGGYYYRLLTGTALFTTSATVANRLAGFQVTDGANVLGYVTQTVAITATQAPTITYGGGNTWAFSSAAPNAQILSMPGIWLPSGYVLQSKTTAISAADQYSAVFLLFEALDYGAYGIPEAAHMPTIAEREILTAAP